jgi:hypothetical protein
VAAGAVDAAAGVDGGAAEVQAGHERARTAEADGRAEDELLMELHGATADGAEAQSGVAGLQGRGALQIRGR